MDLTSIFKRKNIWFNCPACEKKLVVDIEAGGFRADCPECGKNIPIPKTSTTYPAWAKKALVLALQVALVFAGVGVGWYFTNSSESQPIDARSSAGLPVEAKSQPAESVDEPEKNKPVEEINQALLAEHAELQGKFNKMVQWMIDNYRGKYPLPERLISRLRITPLNDQNEVNPELVEMLKLTERERELVQDVFDYVRENITETELDNALITDQQPDQITFSIPPYADKGTALKEDLYLTLENTLGSPRFDRMVDVAGEDMREQFNYYGEAARTLTFEIVRPQKEGDHEAYLLIRDGWVVPEGESVRLTKVTEKAVTALPDSYQPYREFFPENLAQYASP
jgi:hypothetical protein